MSININIKEGKIVIEDSKSNINITETYTGLQSLIEVVDEFTDLRYPERWVMDSDNIN